MPSDRDARIRERAYHIWVAEGRVDGKAHEHWRRAEREIAAEEANRETAGAAGPADGSAVRLASRARRAPAASKAQAATPTRKPRAKAAKSDTKTGDAAPATSRRKQREPSGAAS